MVKKLFKYETKFYLRHLFPFGIIVLATALFVRILSEFRMDNVVFNIVNGSAQFLFGAAIVILFGAVFGLTIKRFYSNLYSSEGYLSFTLPITASQHIWAKLLAAFTFYMAALVVCFAGFLIVTMGEVFVEYVKAIDYLIDLSIKENGWEAVILFFELVVLALAVLVFEILLFYTCISLGQTAKKKKVFMAFAYYFIYYFITQILGTVLVAVIESLNDSGKIEYVAEYIQQNIDWLLHAVPWAATIITCALSLVLFLVNRSIMTKKLNLE